MKYFSVGKTVYEMTDLKFQELCNKHPYENFDGSIAPNIFRCDNITDEDDLFEVITWIIDNSNILLFLEGIF